jgi:membrane-bound lytic murein transglycosylase B
MNPVILLLFVSVLCQSAAKAENYAGRDDVQSFVSEMTQRHGFDSQQLLHLFAQTQPVAAAIKFIMPPKDPGVRSWHAYRGRFVEPKRIAAGLRFMQRQREWLATAESRFGVPREIIAAIIGVETIYGKHMGRFKTFPALTTLAFDYPPRADLFRRELEELLLLAREEKRDVMSYTGSFAGALGLPQFLPSSIRRHALDFDSDGLVSLENSPADAIGSVANFLVAHGWKTGMPIATQVSVDGIGLSAALEAGIQPSRTPEGWTAAGLLVEKVGAGTTADSALADAPSALIDLVTPNAKTEYRLGYHNFYVITRYNRSSFYASAVMDLAAELRRSN